MLDFFPDQQRKKLVQKITSTHYDIVIVGGGVTGAGIALDAASRGLKVALFEKEDFASGTSSKSTKLIHGGLRYLERLEVGLVYKVGRERSIVHSLAPHLVVPEKMLIPYTSDSKLGKWGLIFGLNLYDYVGGVKGDDRMQLLDTNQLKKIEPILNNPSFNGAGFYAEYRTDDSRLTIEIIKTATRFHADVLNYSKVNHIQFDDDKIQSIKFEDRVSNKTHSVSCSLLVNAAGPWVDKVTQLFEKSSPNKLIHSKGVHIVVKREKLPLNHSIYFQNSDGRKIFAIPRGDTVYIGTTDTYFSDDRIDDICVKDEDIDYLINAVNSSFVDNLILKNDIIGYWAGLRPLINDGTSNVKSLSRKDEMYVSHQSVITIAGGKLTGYRNMAKKVVDKSILLLGLNLRDNKSITHQIPLVLPKFINYIEVERYIDNIHKEYSKYGVSKNRIQYLVHLYGKQTNDILNIYKDLLLSKYLDNIDKTKNVEYQILKSEFIYSITNEFTYYPLDFLLRRTSRMLFEATYVSHYFSDILIWFGQFHDWTNEELEHQKALLENFYKV